MAYQSLYRRSRPLTFAAMIGQEHITRTLSNALLNERLAHAYLFSGPRGTGKTTAAKIFARAMNCADYPTAEPCGRCTSCQNISAGVSIDVIEMDAASNRGIDEIRELRERTRFASGESRYKVYIIDEAHMLTPEACNAFLKTLEEPPAGVVFILATTDPSRLPSTIVSRCQRFDFHLLTVDQIRQRLDQILREENWEAESEALTQIARLAEGSLRDALGILEQCSAYGEEAISAEHVRAVTGATRAEAIGELVGALIDNNLDAGLSILNEIVYSGRDLNLFLRDLTFVIGRLLLSSGGARHEGADQGHGFTAVIEEHQDKIERSRLLDLVELLHEVGGELRHAHFPQYILEITLIRMLRLLHGRLRPAEPLHVEGFTGEQNQQGLETGRPKEPTSGRAGVVKEQETAPQKKDLPAVPVEDRQAPVMEEPAAKTAGREKQRDNIEAEKSLEGSGEEQEISVEKRLTALREAWPRLLNEIKKRQKSTAAWLAPASLSGCRGNLVVFTYVPEYQVHQERLMNENHRKLVEAVLTSFCREKIEIRAELGEVEHAAALQPEEYEASGAPIPEPDPIRESELKPKGVKKAPSIEEARQIFGGKGKIIDSN